MYNNLCLTLPYYHEIQPFYEIINCKDSAKSQNDQYYNLATST